MIVSRDKVRAALDRAQDLGAHSVEEACAAAAQALAIPIEAVREVAHELTNPNESSAPA